MYFCNTFDTRTSSLFPQSVQIMGDFSWGFSCFDKKKQHTSQPPFHATPPFMKKIMFKEIEKCMKHSVMTSCMCVR